jgi:alcohol dehydrogenase class IV
LSQIGETTVSSLNTSDNLQSLGVQKKDFEKLAEICVLDGSTSRNPLPITAQDFLDIYERMYQAVA